MTAQCDLRVEAAHLRRFYANFRRLAGSVVVPRPVNGATRARVAATHAALPAAAAASLLLSLACCRPQLELCQRVSHHAPAGPPPRSVP